MNYSSYDKDNDFYSLYSEDNNSDYMVNFYKGYNAFYEEEVVGEDFEFENVEALSGYWDGVGQAFYDN